MTAIACFWLAGCGGGGGGGGNEGTLKSSAPPPHLSFSPAAAAATGQLGTSIAFIVTATFSQEAVDKVEYIGFEDVDGLIDSVEAISSSAANRTITLQVFVSEGLPVGEHKGTLNFYLCEDDDCYVPMRGSPFALPYVITIEPLKQPSVLPTSLSLTVQADESKSATLTVQFSSAANTFFALSDSADQFDTEFELVQSGATTYSLQVRTLPTDVPGTTTGNLRLLVCLTTPCTEQNDALTAPVTIPYSVTVVPEDRLQPIPTLSGVPEWETHQGNAGHTGYVPIVVSPADFALRWSWEEKLVADAVLSPVTVGSGKVVASSANYFSAASLVALNESDGTIAWRHEFGDVFSANHPAVWGGRVFVATSGHDDTAMWTFDLADGSVKARTNFDSQWEHYLAPTIKDGHVFTNGGYYGGMYSFRGIDGTKRWFANLQQYDLWTPAVDDQYAYAYTGYEFAIVDRRNGSRVATIPNPAFNWRGYALNIAPVLPGDGSVLVVDGIYKFDLSHANHLIKYDVATRSEAWRVSGTFVSNPVVAANRVYVLDRDTNRLEARELSTGALVWSWALTNAEDHFPVGNMIVTDNLIFFSTTLATYALDLTTKSVVWQQPTVGHLAISSNKVLYIVGSKRIDAFDLQ